MKTCPKCAEQVQDAAKACRYCGYRFPEGNPLVRGIAVVAVIIVIGIVGGDYFGGPGQPTLPATQLGHSDPVALAKILDHPWAYSHDSDKMGKGATVSATTNTNDTVNFRPPYDGGSTATLQVRKHPRYGLDVIFSISKGQIVCDVEGCPIEISFDGRKPHRFTGNEPSDYSSTALFISPAGGVIKRLKTAKEATIEVSFFQDGNRQFTFNTINLHWPPKATD